MQHDQHNESDSQTSKQFVPEPSTTIPMTFGAVSGASVPMHFNSSPTETQRIDPYRHFVLIKQTNSSQACQTPNGFQPPQTQKQENHVFSPEQMTDTGDGLADPTTNSETVLKDPSPSQNIENQDNHPDPQFDQTTQASDSIDQILRINDTTNEQNSWPFECPFVSPSTTPYLEDFEGMLLDSPSPTSIQDFYMNDSLSLENFTPTGGIAEAKITSSEQEGRIEFDNRILSPSWIGGHSFASMGNAETESESLRCDSNDAIFLWSPNTPTKCCSPCSSPLQFADANSPVQGNPRLYWLESPKLMLKNEFFETNQTDSMLAADSTAELETELRNDLAVTRETDNVDGKGEASSNTYPDTTPCAAVTLPISLQQTASPHNDPDDLANEPRTMLKDPSPNPPSPNSESQVSLTDQELDQSPNSENAHSAEPTTITGTDANEFAPQQTTTIDDNHAVPSSKHQRMLKEPSPSPNGQNMDGITIEVFDTDKMEAFHINPNQTSKQRMVNLFAVSINRSDYLVVFNETRCLRISTDSPTFAKPHFFAYISLKKRLEMFQECLYVLKLFNPNNEIVDDENLPNREGKDLLDHPAKSSDKKKAASAQKLSSRSAQQSSSSRKLSKPKKKPSPTPKRSSSSQKPRIDPRTSGLCTEYGSLNIKTEFIREVRRETLNHRTLGFTYAVVTMELRNIDAELAGFLTRWVVISGCQAGLEAGQDAVLRCLIRYKSDKTCFDKHHETNTQQF
ncbi:hypothetical protein BLNAU_10891 [Blattamonas nauphoetae]|uniref:Uncharacterized protein n=1 Tax=Blattamonas nauphoetae TaxID=2049346 RepID=A0ABQ9XR28_9EUKA|nr:hypothetical protein BLNAU_10891 [Blattamonas nauphoetae]